MLQNLLRKLVLEKCDDSKVQNSVSQSVDDTEVILRRNKQSQQGRHRQRITSCPDAAHLRQLHTQSTFNMLNLRGICEEGNRASHSSHSQELLKTDLETNKENDEDAIFCPFTEYDSGSSDTLEDESSIDLATVERLAGHFDSCVTEALQVVLSLPEGEYKQDMLHSLEYQLTKLKQSVTENCHAVIFSMLVKVE